MKITMLGWELPPHNSGGLGVACYEIAKGLAIEGLSIDFVLPYSAEHGIEEFNVHGASDLSATQVLQGQFGAYDSASLGCDSDCNHSPSNDLRSLQKHYTKYVERHITRLDPDVIHAHDWLTFEAGMRAKQLTQKPLIAHVHATEFDRSGEHSGNPIVHDIEYNGLMMADRIIAVSHITKRIIAREYGIASSKIEVVHNAINTSSIAEEISSAQTYVYLEKMKQQGYSVVVSLGRLTVQKGLQYFLDAAAQASSVNNKLLFLIAGSGEQRDELIAKAAALGIADKVIFTGFVRGKQWRDAYRIGDMFVMSSVSEPFGLTALEAAGYGNAIILTKQSGVGEVLSNALRYDYWDTERLANQMAAVSTHAELKRSLQDNVLDEFKTFDWQDASNKCRDIYRQHAKQPAGVPA
ncbi:hypothetical protein CYG49_00545 [Candidatus Saccharibacteria bacterium]|nr:MAG: hypothetical protein CYG49_00545 [Candidatus Saccharibacteria bacterium]